MIRRAGDESGQARAADPGFTGSGNLDAVVAQNIQDAAISRNGNNGAA